MTRMRQQERLLNRAPSPHHRLFAGRLRTVVPIRDEALADDSSGGSEPGDPEIEACVRLRPDAGRQFPAGPHHIPDDAVGSLKFFA